jgi:hypothetical protein
MALFNHDEIVASAYKKSSAESILLKGHFTYWDSTQQTIREKFDDYVFSPDNNVLWNSYGEWSMHELLYYMLVRSGASNVYITTWAISEIAMRSLCNYMKEGLIKELHLLCDYRNTSRKPAELAYIEQNATRIKLGKCHAKLTVIDAQAMPVLISGSANYTRNPRFESGSVHFGKEPCDFQKAAILNQMSDERNNLKRRRSETT